MGTDISRPKPDKLHDVVLKSLSTANYLVKTSGIGANATNDTEDQQVALHIFGLSKEISAHLTNEMFINGLMENDTYQLCASI